MTQCQNEMLMTVFQDNAYPKSEEKRQLAKSFGLSETQVRRWFINMRRRKKIEGVSFESE